jgi:uncharacterized Fe-S center protein
MSEVVWIDVARMASDNSVAHKLERLVNELGVLDDLVEGMRVALKVNTAEDGYEYGLRPGFLRTVADAVREKAAGSPIVCDGLKLVDYWRPSKGHAFMDVARGKGYTADSVGGNFVINGGYSGDEGNAYSCRLPDAELGGVEVGTAVCRTDALWVLSHVTLHPLFGLSGALLNGGFECLIGRERMRILDGIDPYPFNGSSPPEEQLAAFQRRALEGHLGVREAMEGRVVYLNYLWDVTPQPEYFPYSEMPVAENMGFLLARDPVALDAATFQLLAGYGAETGTLDPVTRLTSVTFDNVLAQAEAFGLGSRDHSIRRLS